MVDVDQYAELVPGMVRADQCAKLVPRVVRVDQHAELVPGMVRVEQYAELVSGMIWRPVLPVDVASHFLWGSWPTGERCRLWRNFGSPVRWPGASRARRGICWQFGARSRWLTVGRAGR